MDDLPDVEEIDPRLVVLTRNPLNAESPLNLQIGSVTPNELFYFRNRFTGAPFDAATWRLRVGGQVERPVEFTFDEILDLPSRTLLITMECAGNGRTNFVPEAEGEPWEYGAVSTAEWTGVALGTVLAAAGLTGGAREILLEGADRGAVDSSGEVVPFARSLDLETALHPDTLLAYGMNGDLLPVRHGRPLRLVVPGWYGMTAVKWINRIEAIGEPFEGFFQVERYIFETPGVTGRDRPPVTRAGVRSLITNPVKETSLPRGAHRVRGLAWSGHGSVTRVEFSGDGGATWQPAELTSDPQRYAWRRWECVWQAEQAGPARLCSRAFDEAGNEQPPRAEWNRLGYANNAIQTIELTLV